MKKFLPSYFSLFLILGGSLCSAQSAGDYRSKQTGNWSDVATWETYNGSNWADALAYPRSADGIIIILVNHTIISNIAVTVNQLVVNSGGNLNITAASFTLADGPGTDLNCSGVVTLSGGSIDGTGLSIFRSGSVFTWSGGFLRGKSTTIINSGAGFTMNGSDHYLGDSATINNNGVWNWTNGTFYYYNGAPIVNNTGRFNISTDADVAPYFGNTGTFNNKAAGIITKTGVTNEETYFNGFSAFINEGIININTGRLNFLVNSFHSATVNVVTGATMRFAAGNASFNAGFTFPGTGNLSLENGIFNLNVPVSLTNTIFNLTGGTLLANAAVTMSSGSIFNFVGGNFLGNAGININSGCTFNWSGGLLGGSDSMNIRAGANLNINGGNVFLGDTRALNNYGTCTWTGGSFIYYNGSPEVNNYGALNIFTDADVSPHFGNTGTFNNRVTGSITKIGSPDNETSFSGFATFTNEGIININSSKLNVAVNSTFTKSISVAYGAAMRFTNGTASFNPGTALLGEGEFNFEAGSFLINTNLTISAAVINLSGGSLRGTSSLSMNSGTTFNWSGGLNGGSGSLNIKAGANFNTYSGTLYLADTKTINNSGIWTWTSGTLYYYYGYQKINNYGTFNIHTDNDVTGAGSAAAFFYNRPGGVINKIGSPADETYFNGFGSFFNEGKINIQSSKINIATTTATYTSLINADLGSTFRQTANTANYNKGNIFSGKGIISLDAGVIQFNTNVSITSNTLNFKGGYLIGDSALIMKTGTTFNWTGGTYGGGGISTIDAGANFNMISGGLYIADGRTINNYGSWHWTGGTLYYYGGNPAINNYGTFNINRDADVGFSGVASIGSFINQAPGIINKNGLTNEETSFTGFTTFNNLGKIHISSGNLALNVDGLHAGSYTIAAGSQLRGNINMKFTGSAFTNNGMVTLNELNFSKTSLQTLTGTGSINTLIINNAGGVSLGGSQTVNTRLTLAKGKIICNSNNLLLGASIQLSAGTPASYIVTNSTGTLQRRVVNDSSFVPFPVGTASTFMPAALRLSRASVTDTFKVRVLPNLYGQYDASKNPKGSPITDNVVNSTWFIGENTNGGTNATVTLQWSGINESVGFSRTQSSFGHFSGSSWTLDTTQAAFGSDPYSLTRANVTALAGFGIFNQFVYCLNTYPLICRGNVNVPYKAVGIFSTGNKFTAQLSDSTGSFATPVTIGSNTATASGNIAAIIPNSTIPASGYRIRVISSNPSIASPDNASDITIGSCNAIIPGIEFACPSPEGLKISGVGETKAVVSWNAFDGTDYVFYYKKSGAIVWTQINAYATSLVIDQLEPNTSYIVKVLANCRFGNPRYSAELMFKTINSKFDPALVKSVANEISIYPNPNNGLFTIAFQHKGFIAGYATLEIMNASGKSVHYEKISSSANQLIKGITLPPSFASGMYTIKIIVGKQAYYGRMICNRR